MTLSPLSTRYSLEVKNISEIFSDTQYFIQRVRVEFVYLRILFEKKNLSNEKIDILKNIFNSIESEIDVSYERFTQIDKITKHDVKAIEYFIKEKLDHYDLSEYKEFVHCGLTSQDINSVAFTIILNNVISQLKTEFKNFIDSINILLKNTDIVTIGYTHGQRAIPVNMSYELSKLIDKIQNTINDIIQIELSAKFSSSTGNYTTLQIIFSTLCEIDKLYSNLNKYLDVDIKFTKKARQIDDYTSYMKFLFLIEKLSIDIKEFTSNIWLKIHRNELIQNKRDGEMVRV